jgi:hypothetical protein
MNLRARVKRLEAALRVATGNLNPAEQAELDLVPVADVQVAMHSAAAEARNATMAELRAASAEAQPAPAGSLWEAMHAAQERELADNPHAELSEVYGVMIREVAAAAKERFNDPHFPVRWSDVVLWLEQEAGGSSSQED